MPCRNRDLELVFSVQFERAVNRDNTVSFQNLWLQLERVGWRATLAGCQVTVHQRLDGTLSLTHGPHGLGRFKAQGQALAQAIPPARRAMEKTRGGKVRKTTFPPRLEIPQSARDSHFPTAPATVGSWSNRTYYVLQKPDLLTCYGQRVRFRPMTYLFFQNA